MLLYLVIALTFALVVAIGVAIDKWQECRALRENEAWLQGKMNELMDKYMLNGKD